MKLSDKAKRIYYISWLIIFVSILFVLVIFSDKIYFFAKKVIYWSLEQTTSSGIVSKQAYVISLADGLSWAADNIWSKKDIVSSYCNVVLNKTPYKAFSNSTFVYAPNKSFFIYHLCNYVDTDYAKNFWQGKKNWVESIYEYKKDYDIRNYFDSSLASKCDPEETDMNGCNFSEFIPKIFAWILNEIWNIKLANIYGFSMWETDEIVKKFSNQYYPTKDCWDKYYLSPDQLEDNIAFCSHPKTYKILVDTIKNVQMSIEKSKFIEAENLLDVDKKETKSNGKCSDKSIKSAFSNCSSSWSDFKNVLYNELFYYNMFVAYYLSVIRDEPRFNTFAITSDVSSEIDNANLEVYLMQKEIEVSPKAIEQMDKVLRNVYATYPIHIWLLAYYEDLIKFRSRLSKLYTPIHQLYYKLRNVQDVSAK